MKLTKEELKAILNMLEAVSFKGVKSAESLIALRNKLLIMLKEEGVDDAQPQTKDTAS